MTLFDPETKNRKKLYLILGASLVICIITFFIGQSLGTSNATAVLNDEKATLEDFQKEMATNKNKILHLNSEITKYEEETEKIVAKKNSQKEELAALQEEFKEVSALINKKDSISKDLKALEASLEEKKQEIADLETLISEAEAMLEKLIAGLVEKEQEPFILPAGVFVVGHDLPEGRYRIEPHNGRGNYFVNEGMKTNIILGKGDSFYLPEYVLFLTDADVIEAGVSVRYTGVE